MIDTPIFRWILDVAPLWPSSGESAKREITKDHWANVQSSHAALKLLSSAEREKVLRFYFASDAKLSLGSCLLKRKAVTDTCQIPWSDVVIGQDSNKKPCFKADRPSGKPLAFNVSHHGSLVALVGCSRDEVQLGVDLVKIDFEKDYVQVIEKGFVDWASTYESIFSKQEMEDIVGFAAGPGSAEQHSQETVRAQLRHFYAFWCLKEAFFKMTGEGLLSSELHKLEFRNVQAPNPNAHSDSDESCWGEISRNFEVCLNGQLLNSISMEIQAYQDDYLVASAASISSAAFASFQKLSYERDILPSSSD